MTRPTTTSSSDSTVTGTELSLAEDPGAAAAGLTRGAMWCSEAGCRSRLCSAPRGGDVLAHPASPAADDPDLQLHPGGAVPRRAADEVALPGAVEPDRVAAGHERGRPAGCRASRGARGQEPLEEELALAGPGRCDRAGGGRKAEASSSTARRGVRVPPASHAESGGGGAAATTGQAGWSASGIPTGGGRYFKYRPPPGPFLAVGWKMCGPDRLLAEGPNRRPSWSAGAERDARGSRRRRRRAAELRNCAAPDLLARQRATASNACKLQQPRAHKATTARRAQLVSCGHGLRFRARAALAPLQQCVQLGRSGPRRRPWRASRGCCFRERRSGEPRTARSRRAALPRRTDGGWLETSPAGDGEVRLGARGQQPTSEREKPPRRGGGVALRRATESQRSGLLATTGHGRGVSSADRVDGISNTVHPWASFNRRMVDVRARIDWGLQRSAREPSRSSSPGRAGAGAARCAMAEGPGRGLRGSSARQPRRRIKPRTTEEFQTAGQLQSSCFGQVIRC